ncbi:MAG: PQQ-binding-like beta-propeller repeat protein, partial [Pirellulales bacterium]
MRCHRQRATVPALASLLIVVGVSPATAGDRPQWGRAWSRNMVSSETDLPAEFEPGRRNRQTGGIDLPADSRVRWVVPTGSETCGTPVVAGGRVYVGTNNAQPRDPRYQGDRGVLMCLDERTGRLHWQLVVPKLTRVKWGDWRMIGLTSPPTIEGDRAYVVSNRDAILCLD